VEAAIQTKLDAGEAFTSACISHPLIQDDAGVRHHAVNTLIKEGWVAGGFEGSDDGMQVEYVRTLIDVFPNGPGSSPIRAFCYHPDNGYDPLTFNHNKHVLVRNPTDLVDDWSAATSVLTNTADGGVITRQCQIQTKDSRLNIPRFIVSQTGWAIGDNYDTERVGDAVNIRSTAFGHKCVDAEGRIRLGGTNVVRFDGQCTASLVDDGNGDKYIQVTK